MKKRLPIVCVLTFLFLVLDASQIVLGKSKSEIPKEINFNYADGMQPADNMKIDTLQAFQIRGSTKKLPYKKHPRIKLLII